MKYANLVFLVILLVLAACSGEAYIRVNNNTPGSILVSINHNADEVLLPGDTTDTYTVSVSRGIVNQIPVTASGEWLSDYNESIAVANGDVVVHRIHPQQADLSFINTSVDSAILRYENTRYPYFAGGDSVRAMHTADGNVILDYEGRYIFTRHEEKSWFPGERRRFELVPDACEIQLNNIHPNRAVYYVFISPSTADTWGEDKLGANTILYPGEGYVWKAEGGVRWDMRIEAGDPHPDSALFAYEFYDTEGCAADFTWIYEFPTIFTPLGMGKLSKTGMADSVVLKAHALQKTFPSGGPVYRIEKIGKKNTGLAKETAIKK